jgi:hypothetical protein
MPTLSPEDASILALAAEHPGMPEEMLNRLLERTESERARRILRALNAKRTHAASDDVRSAVKGLRQWAERNSRVHSAPSRTKKR